MKKMFKGETEACGWVTSPMAKLYNMKGCSKNNRKGFTLVEMITAVAILAILVSIAVVGVIGYSNNLKATEMDNTARQIFVAAQNHMAQAKASGEWAAYVEEKEKELGESKPASTAEATIGQLLKNKPSDMATLYWGGEHQDRYRYITHEARETSKLQSSILKYMLPFGAIDDEIRVDGSYVIEYDSLTGNVYGVFYTDNELGVDENDINTLDTTNREDSTGRFATPNGKRIRRDYTKTDKRDVIGYYGGAGANYIQAVKLNEPEVVIENGEKLVVNIEDHNYFLMQGGTQYRTRVAVSIKGVESGKTTDVALELKDDGNGNKKDDQDVWWNVGIVKESSSPDWLEYSLTLDDITAQGGHFANLFPEFIPGENIIINVKCTSEYVFCDEKEDNAMTNSLFADRINTPPGDPNIKSIGKVTVKAVRHIENLDPTISNLPTNYVLEAVGDSNKVMSRVEKVSQQGDINFANAEDSDGSKIFTEGSIFGYNENGNLEVAVATNAFSPISNGALSEYNGNGYKLQDFKINTSGSAGLFSKIGVAEGINQVLICKYLTLENFDVSGIGSSGSLVGIVSNGATLKASDIKVINPKVTVTGNKGNAGGLVGNTSIDEEDWEDEIKYCGVYATSAAIYIGDKCGIKATGTDGNAGGLIGNMRGGEVSYCFASVPVEATAGNAGGLIGRVSKSKTDSTWKKEIKNCYVGGITKNVTVDGSEVARFTADDPNYISVKAEGNTDTSGFAGGLIGFAAGRLDVDDCFTACSVLGAKAGGFIGKDSSSRTSESNFRKCYVAGLTKAISGGEAATFAQVAGNAKMVNCKYLAGINGNNTSAGSLAIIETPDVLAKTYENLSESQNIDTHRYNNLPAGDYPFKGVNKTCISANSTDDAAYYGDWEVPEDETGQLYLAYREVVKGDSYWHIVKASVKGGNATLETIYDNLLKTPRVHKIEDDDDSSYGILLKEDNMADVMVNDGYDYRNPNRVFKNGFNYTANPIIDGTQYYFYELMDPTGNPKDGYETKKFYANEGKDPISLWYNNYFAASIALNQEDLGTESNPYQVRNREQLRAIGLSEDLMSSYYIQNIDIDAKENSSGFDRYAINGSYAGGTAFNGHYSAKVDQNNNYVVNFAKDNNDLGLFEEIGSGGVVDSVNITGDFSTFDISQSTPYGSLCGKNRGTVSNCHVKTEYTLSTTVSSNIGGVVGYNYGTIELSSFEGKLNVYGTWNSPNVGGIIGYNFAGGICKTSYSNASFVSSNSNAKIGGAIGRMSGGEIENCYAISDFTRAVGSSFKLLIGTNSSPGVEIINCHAFEKGALDSPSMPRNIQFTGNQVGNIFTNCYEFSKDSNTNLGLNRITNASDYDNFETFVGWDANIWEITNGKYPTLKDNPEPTS